MENTSNDEFSFTNFSVILHISSFYFNRIFIAFFNYVAPDCFGANFSQFSVIAFYAYLILWEISLKEFIIFLESINI